MSATDLSWGFVLLWFGGELLGVLYTWSIGALPMVVNYAANVLLLIPIIAVKGKYG